MSSMPWHMIGNPEIITEILELLTREWFDIKLNIT